MSWTAIISANVQDGKGDAALQLFIDMLRYGMKPNELTVSSLCGSLAATKLGEQIHSLIYKLGFNDSIFVDNSLITMYFKCRCEDGFRVFKEMTEQDIVKWNAYLAGCAQIGLGKEAIKIFERMESRGLSPKEISILGLLCACIPSIHHYTCSSVTFQLFYQLEPKSCTLSSQGTIHMSRLRIFNLH